MNTTAVRKLRRRLAADLPVFGLWVTLDAPSVTEMAVGLGVDWVVIDAEHGHLDWHDIVAHLRATARGETVALVRIAELNGGTIKRALDLGADGVVVPWVETADQLRQAVEWAKYPPEGKRGIGAERATAWGQALVEHTAEANDHVLVVPIIETVRAASDVPAMCAVLGVELFYFGPADFSASAGYRGQWEGPGIAGQILGLKDVIRGAGKHCGVLATGNDNLLQRLDQGFRMVGVGMDAGLLLRSLNGALAAVGHDRPLRASLAPESDFTTAPVRRPPESFRPDRSAVISRAGEVTAVEIEPGVLFECLVGSHNQARNLTTGLVHFTPTAELSYHTHPFTESITLLRGRAAVEAEGRVYELGPLDNVAIPAGLAHAARNLSAQEPAVFHIAMATHEPMRTRVTETFRKRPAGRWSAGQPGAERVTRFRVAPRGQAGPNTEFIDFFNRDLLPGVEMSGGYGLFLPGGRLPAHVHDFDESICIIDGAATCVVEGETYELADTATALVPRGRVHYFANDGDRPMAMLWVYAGPTPERIVVDERCATRDGNPWGPSVR